MTKKLKIKDNAKSYFLTLNTIGWVDIFTKKEQKQLIIEALNEYQKNNGLEIFAFCLMSNYLHLICRAREGYDLSTIIKDFKKKTTKLITKIIKLKTEKRKEWLLEIFRQAFDHLKPESRFKIWQGNNHAVLIYSDEFLIEKINYLHNDPVENLIIEKPEDYIMSSARNYAHLKGVLEVTVIDKLNKN